VGSATKVRQVLVSRKDADILSGQKGEPTYRSDYSEESDVKECWSTIAVGFFETAVLFYWTEDCAKWEMGLAAPFPHTRLQTLHNLKIDTGRKNRF
jgi:hypothetical protein